MAKYDLTSALETKFTFAIDGKEYEFRKPTVREMRALAKMFTAVDQDDDPEKQVEASDAAMAELYRYIIPIDHDTPVYDLISDQPIGVQAAFNEMVKKELGA